MSFNFSNMTIHENPIKATIFVFRKICPNTTIAAINDTPVYQPAYPTAQDIINDTKRKENCKLFFIVLGDLSVRSRFVQIEVDCCGSLKGLGIGSK